MKAAYIEETGGPGNIRYGDLPDPIAASGKVLVKVGAVSVNPIDTYMRSGMVPAELPMPFVVGSDLAVCRDKYIRQYHNRYSDLHAMILL